MASKNDVELPKESERQDREPETMEIELPDDKPSDKDAIAAEEQRRKKLTKGYCKHPHLPLYLHNFAQLTDQSPPANRKGYVLLDEPKLWNPSADNGKSAEEVRPAVTVEEETERDWIEVWPGRRSKWYRDQLDSQAAKK